MYKTAVYTLVNGGIQGLGPHPGWAYNILLTTILTFLVADIIIMQNIR